MFRTQATLHIHSISVLSSTINHSWNQVYKRDRYLVFWMHFSRTFHWFSFVSWIELKLADAHVYGDFGSTSVFDVGGIRKKKEIFQLELSM